jgi:hypothetical protein
VPDIMAWPGDDGYARREIVRLGEPLAVPASGKTIVGES